MSKEKARHFYLEGLNLTQIAGELGVNIKSVSLWKKQDTVDWDKLRAVHQHKHIEHLAQVMLFDFLEQFRSAMQLIHDSHNIDAVTKTDLLSKLSDSYAKAIGTNKKLMPEVNTLRVAYLVIEKLTEHIQQHHQEILGEFLQSLENFDVNTLEMS